MDPISAIHSLISLASAVKAWLDARQEKEAVIVSISTAVTRIYDVIAPLEGPAAKSLDLNVVSAFLGIGDVLHRTKEHLIAWGVKRPNSLSGITIFFAPGQINKALKEDERDLNNQLIMMLFTLAMKEFFHDTASPESQRADHFYLGSVVNEKILGFWRDYIGAKVAWPSLLNSVKILTFNTRRLAGFVGPKRCILSRNQRVS
jgi:hypothetical protein